MSAYFVFRNRMLDADKMNEYVPKALEAMAPYNPEILVFDENTEVIEGETDLPRTFVVRFASRDDALAWYRSAEYQAVLPLRLEATEGTAVLIDGYEPPAE